MHAVQLDSFLELLRQEPRLQQRLWEADEPDAFTSLVRTLAAERGLDVAVDDVRARLRVDRAEWRDHAIAEPTTPCLEGWIPIRVSWVVPQPVVEWCYIGRRRYSEPFFAETVRA